MHVTVDHVAEAPLLTAAVSAGTEDHAVSLNLTAAPALTDGSETISSVQIIGVPDGFALSEGSSAGHGQWDLSQADLARLQLNPAADWNGSVSLTLEAMSQSGASHTTSSHDFNVTVTPVNDPPRCRLPRRVTLSPV